MDDHKQNWWHSRLVSKIDTPEMKLSKNIALDNVLNKNEVNMPT